MRFLTLLTAAKRRLMALSVRVAWSLLFIYLIIYYRRN